MVLSHHGCNAHHKPGPLVAFRFSCWSLEIRYDKMSFYEAYQTWIFLSQVFGWYLKLPNCVMSKSSHLFSQRSSHPGWQIDWEVSLIGLGGDRLMWRPFVWDATKTIGIWPWKTMTSPNARGNSWVLHKLRNRDINTLNRHQPGWLRKDSVWHPTLWANFLESTGGIQVFHLSTRCEFEFLPVLKNLRYKGFFQRVEGTVFFFSAELKQKCLRYVRI